MFILNYYDKLAGFRLVNTKCMAIIDLWKKLQHSNIIQLREVFTTKAFGDHCKLDIYYPMLNTVNCNLTNCITWWYLGCYL